VIVLVGLFSISSMITPSYAKEYVNYDGKPITEDQYEKRVGYCGNMKFDKEIPMSTDCHEWVLTEDGYVKIALYSFKLYGLD
jgi:hypothetical protein